MVAPKKGMNGNDERLQRDARIPSSHHLFIPFVERLPSPPFKVEEKEGWEVLAATTLWAPKIFPLGNDCQEAK